MKATCAHPSSSNCWTNICGAFRKCSGQIQRKRRIGSPCRIRFFFDQSSRELRIMFALCLAFAPLALGDAPHAPTFATTSASGEPLRGQVTKLQSDWSITLTGEKPGTVAGGDLISLRRAGAKLPAFPAGPHLVFANGDRLAGEVLAIEKDRVQFKARLGTGSNADVVQELSIPLPAVAAIWFQAPTHEGMSGIGRQWLTERRRR